MTTPATAAPTTAITRTNKQITTTISTTISLSTPEIINADDHDFNSMMRKNEGERRKVFPVKSKSAEKDGKADEKKVDEVEEEEEGSTPNVLLFTPGYDYVVDPMTEEDRIIDLDVFTTASPLKNPVKSTTTVSHSLITPTLQLSPLTVHITRALTTSAYSTPHTSTEMWAKTTHFLSDPHTTSHVNPPWTHRVALTTPMYKYRSVTSKTGYHARKAPSTTESKQSTMTALPQPTLKTNKMKKLAVTPKKTTTATRAKKPTSRDKGSRSKSQKQRSGHHKSSSGSDQSNLMAIEPVDVDVFWVVGNWSEVLYQDAILLSNYRLDINGNV